MCYTMGTLSLLNYIIGPCPYALCERLSSRYTENEMSELLTVVGSAQLITLK